MKCVVGKLSKASYPLEPWSLIGQGSEGCVYSAGGMCVKVLSVPPSGDEAQKIEALARLSRDIPGVAWPAEVVVDPATGRPAGFAMPLVPGETLESLLDGHTTRDIEVVTKVTLALQVAEAVAAAHRHHGPKVVLGDVLKAGNLVIDARAPSAVLVDAASVSLFGFRLASGRVTDSWASINTPGYVPKEVLENPGALPSHDADRFALAVLLFELLFGWPPYQPKPGPGSVGLEPDQAIRRGIFPRWVRRQEFTAPRYDDVELPDGVEGLFRASFLASARRPTADEWAEALRDWREALEPPPEEPEAAPPPPARSRFSRLDLAALAVLAAWAALSLVDFVSGQVVPGGITNVVPLPRQILGPALFRELFK